MRLNSTAVGTVIHLKSLKNLNSFLKSVDAQTDKNFDLLILNVSRKKLNIKKKNIQIIPFKFEKSINENRIKLIKEVIKKKYENLIFIDSDDTMMKNRVKVCKKYLKKNKIIVNDLNIFDKKNVLVKKKYFSSRIKNKTKINKLFLRYKNIFGMSNTSCKVSVLKKINLNVLINAPIFDWALWMLVLQNERAIFTNSTSTNYLISKKSINSFYNQNKKIAKKRNEIKNDQFNYFIRNNLIKLNSYHIKNKSESKFKFWWE